MEQVTVKKVMMSHLSDMPQKAATCSNVANVRLHSEFCKWLLMHFEPDTGIDPDLEFAKFKAARGYTVSKDENAKYGRKLNVNWGGKIFE